MGSPCIHYNLMGKPHPDRCHFFECPQGSAHHPHDWAREIDDVEWDWLDYLNSQSARERGDLRCGVCHQLWPCETKQAHVRVREEARHATE